MFDTGRASSTNDKERATLYDLIELQSFFLLLFNSAMGTHFIHSTLRSHSHSHILDYRLCVYMCLTVSASA